MSPFGLKVVEWVTSWFSFYTQNLLVLIFIFYFFIIQRSKCKIHEKAITRLTLFVFGKLLTYRNVPCLQNWFFPVGQRKLLCTSWLIGVIYVVLVSMFTAFIHFGVLWYAKRIEFIIKRNYKGPFFKCFIKFYNSFPTGLCGFSQKRRTSPNRIAELLRMCHNIISGFLSAVACEETRCFLMMFFTRIEKIGKRLGSFEWRLSFIPRDTPCMRHCDQLDPWSVDLRSVTLTKHNALKTRMVMAFCILHFAKQNKFPYLIFYIRNR